MVSGKSCIKHIHELLEKGEITCTELTEKYLSAIEKDDEKLKSYVSVTRGWALNTAKKVDEKLSRKEKLLPLEGIPMALKDNICTKGIKTTCSSNMLKNYIPPYDATVWEILKSQNAVLLGKTNMDEFAMGCSCETSYFAKTNNPHDCNRVPGGSSGGSAAAIAGNLAACCLGSDTGGSIRQPSSFCGIVGLKPTYGSISRYGLIALASSLDQIGPMTRSVEDASIIYDALSVKDPRDMTSCGKINAESHMHLNDDLKGMKIGILKQYFEGVKEEIKTAIDNAIKVYKSLGAEIVYLDMPDVKYSLPIYYILVCSEAASNLARLDGIRYGHKATSYKNMDEFFIKDRAEGFGDEVKRRILLGTYFHMKDNYENYYKKALRIRSAIIEMFNNAFKECDVLISATVAETAFLHDFKPDDQMQAYLTDICTVPVNIAGLCAVSVPCGVDQNKLPVGMQLIGGRFCEYKILNAAYKFEQMQCGKNYKEVDMGVSL